MFQRHALLQAALICGLFVGGGPAFGATAAPTRQQVVLQLKWQHQFQFAGYYAAIEKGFYREAGLEVELREAVPGQDPVEEVLAGRAQFGVGTSDLVLLRGQGKPVVVLAVIFQHSPLVLLAARRDGVNHLHDLHDKPLMIEPQSAELFAYFKSEGVDPKRLNVRHHTFNVDALIGGTVAAMSGYSTDEPFQLRQSGVDFLTFTARAGGIDFYRDNLFTTADELRVHPERVRALRRASLRGWEYALAHPEEIVDLILRHYSTRKTRAHLLFEAQQTAQLVHPTSIEIGHMNAGRWQHIAGTYTEFGLLAQSFALDGFLYDARGAPDLRWVYWALAVAGVLATAGLGWALRLNRRLRRSEREFRELAENAPFPVAITDIESGKVLFVNREATDLFGDGSSDLVGEPAVNFYEDPADRTRLISALQAGEVVRGMEFHLHARNGRPVWSLVSAATVEFGGRRGVVVAFQDITRRRMMEDELRRAKDAAEAASAAKTGYLAVLSHEVRTPLNGMIGMAALLRTEQLTGEGREHLEILERSGQALLRLVSDLLDFARADSGRVELEHGPLEVVEFTRELCVLFRPAAEAKGVALRHDVRPEVPPVVLTDAMRLRQILSNLLANAIKFTASGAVDIVVECVPGSATDAGRCRLRFHVNDTGIGIAPERVARLFEPYAQADATIARRYGGTGLGLSISKRLAQLLGGGIQVQSTPGVGSMFTLEIEVEAVPGPVA